MEQVHKLYQMMKKMQQAPKVTTTVMNHGSRVDYSRPAPATV